MIRYSAGFRCVDAGRGLTPDPARQANGQKENQEVKRVGQVGWDIDGYFYREGFSEGEEERW